MIFHSIYIAFHVYANTCREIIFFYYYYHTTTAVAATCTFILLASFHGDVHRGRAYNYLLTRTNNVIILCTREKKK